MFSGNEANNSLPFKLFWAGGSGRLRNRRKGRNAQILSCVGQALGHSSPTSFLEVGFLFYSRRDRGSELSTRVWNETPLCSMLKPLSITPCTQRARSGRRRGQHRVAGRGCAASGPGQSGSLGAEARLSDLTFWTRYPELLGLFSVRPIG